MSGLTLAQWLEREMPEGTVIGNPRWWATHIERFIAQATAPEREESVRIAWTAFCESWQQSGARSKREPCMDDMRAALEAVWKSRKPEDKT